MPNFIPLHVPGADIRTSRSGSRTGKYRSNTWSIKVKMELLAPMPIASVRTTIAVKPGFERKERSA